MKKFYCVAASYYDTGRAIANIVDSKYSDTKPENGFVSNRRCDTYLEWFDSERKANEYILQCRNA